ncbi:MAG: ZIP family metal transporter [Clostridia bacterium]
MDNIILPSLLAGLMTWGVTALGAMTVFFVKKMNTKFLNLMLGFASGVMIAASFWSLLSPSIEMAEQITDKAWLVAAVGFILGGLFLEILDKIIYDKNKQSEQSSLEHRNKMLILSITIHNIPEGLAVGVAYGLAVIQNDSALYASAFALALGIAIQNFPEGLASAMPLYAQGLSRKKSFFYGQLTGIVEPIAAVFGAILVVYVQPILPYALAFAAGAMIYVVAQELIPESQSNRFRGTSIGTVGVMIGFVCMMILDVALS